MRRVLISLIVAACTVGALAGPAAAGPRQDHRRAESSSQAAPAQSPEDAAAACRQLVAADLTAIGKLRDVIGSTPTVAEEHSADLLARLDGIESDLQSLSGQLESATTSTEVRALCEAVATETAELGLVADQTALVLGADSSLAAVAQIDAVVRGAKASATRMERNGEDTTELRAAIAEVEAHTDAVKELATPIPDTVLAVTLADLGDGGGVTLARATRDLAEAGEELALAVTATEELVALLAA